MELWELVARECCRDTLAQYSHAGDRYLLEEFAGAFCEDGVLEIRGSEPITGRPAIMERFGGPTAAAVAPQRGARPARRCGPAGGAPQRHEHPVRVRDPRRGRRLELLHGLHRGRDPTTWAAIGTGSFPSDERWLIAHRFVSTDWHAADSTFGGIAPA